MCRVGDWGRADVCVCVCVRGGGLGVEGVGVKGSNSKKRPSNHEYRSLGRLIFTSGAIETCRYP